MFKKKDKAFTEYMESCTNENKKPIYSRVAKIYGFDSWSDMKKEWKATELEQKFLSTQAHVRRAQEMYTPTSKARHFEQLPVIKTPADFIYFGYQYLEKCKESRKLPTIAGFCLAVGFTSRKAVQKYSSKSELHEHAVGRMMLELEDLYTAMGVNKKFNGQFTTFYLREHFGYAEDKQSSEILDQRLQTIKTIAEKIKNPKPERDINSLMDEKDE